MFKVIKGILIWIFSNMNYKTVKTYLDIAERLVSMTASNKDNKVYERSSEIIYDLTHKLEGADVKKISDRITKAKIGDLKPYKLSLNLKEGVSIHNDFGSVTYNPKDGKAKVNFNF